MKLTCAGGDEGRRLDRVLRKSLPDMPLSGLYRLLRRGLVRLDGKRARGGERVKAGDEISIRGLSSGKNFASDFVEGGKKETAAAVIIPPILWQGRGLLVLDKPAGLAVHGPCRRGETSLTDAVAAYLAPLLPPSLSFKPGPLHRLDKPTSGCIAFSTSLEGAQWFSRLLQEGRIKKRYLAIIEGALDSAETWEDALLRDRDARVSRVIHSARPSDGGAKAARTSAFPLALSRDGAYSLTRFELDTGRSHQIRAQSAFHGHPLAGDGKYGGKPFPDGLGRGFLLHAYSLEIPLPGPEAPVVVKAPLPERFQKAVLRLFP